MVLVILLVCAVVVGLGLGVLAKMPPRELAGLCAALSAAVLVFYGLVALL